MQSDWGSAFPDQELTYVIAAQNLHTEGELTDVRIRSQLPNNLEVLGATASYGQDPSLVSIDPSVMGNEVVLRLDSFKAGDQAFITINARVKANTQSGSQIISQAELTHSDLMLSNYSNMVSVLVVGNNPIMATAAPTATPDPLATPTEEADATPEATEEADIAPAGDEATETPEPTATAEEEDGDGASAQNREQPAQPEATTPAVTDAALPETSAGIPILGFVMLGMTMMLRTVRLHRAQNRI
jgi:hypothetical protein